MTLMDQPTAPPADQTFAVVQGGTAYLSAIERRLAPYFARLEPRQRALAYLRRLLSPAERKNSWPLAEVRGAATPYGFQHVLGRADWDPDAVRDALRTYVLQHLGDPHGVLGLDETGLLKKGQYSAGVARQYSGAAGRIANCQIGVFLGYAGGLGHTLVDRALYLPQEWTGDRERWRRAGIAEERRCATTPQLAKARLHRALAAGMSATWGTGDRVDGDDRRLRMWLEAQPQAQVWLGWQPRQRNTIVAALPEDSGTRLSAGDGAKGPRWYDWPGLPLADPMDSAWRRWLLVRRSVSDPSELRASVVFAPQDTTLEEVGRVAGTRWMIAQLFEAAKGEVGLDHDEVRRWTGWYRPLTLAMWALALLTVRRAGAIAVEICKKTCREWKRRAVWRCSRLSGGFGPLERA